MREPTEEGNIAPEVAGAGKNLEKANKEVPITEAHRFFGGLFICKQTAIIYSPRIKAVDGLLSPRHAPGVLP